MDALSQLARLNIGSGAGAPTQTKEEVGNEEEAARSPYNVLMDSLQKASPDAILLTPEDVSSLKNMSAEEGATGGVKSKKDGSAKGKVVDKDKDCVLFTCGHHFTNKDFKVSHFGTGIIGWSIKLGPAHFRLGSTILM